MVFNAKRLCPIYRLNNSSMSGGNGRIHGCFFTKISRILRRKKVSPKIILWYKKITGTPCAVRCWLCQLRARLLGGGAKKLRITGRSSGLGFRSARSLRSRASLQHIFLALELLCNSFIASKKHRKQPEHYA
jgi:hypothetical protein